MSSHFKESTIVPIYKGQIANIGRFELFTPATLCSDVCVEVLNVSKKCSATNSKDKASHDKTGLLLALLTLKMEALHSFETLGSHSTDNTAPKFPKILNIPK